MAPFRTSIADSVALSRRSMNLSQGNYAVSTVVPDGVVHSVQPIESVKARSQDASFIVIPHTGSSLAETKDAESVTSDSRSGCTAVTEDSTPIDDDACDRLLQCCLSYPWVAGCQHAEEFVKAQKAKVHLLELEKRKGGGGKGGGGGGGGGGEGTGGWPGFAVEYNDGQKIGLVIGFGAAAFVGLVLTIFGIVYCRECYKERSKRKINERMTVQPWSWPAQSVWPNGIPLGVIATPDHATGDHEQINRVRPAYLDPYGDLSDAHLPRYDQLYGSHVCPPVQNGVYGRPL